jgi:aspartate kinase
VLDATVLQEMAECGAKVVNAQAVEWARKAKIAIYARSTFDAWEKGDGHRQTVVTPVSEAKRAVGAVVGEGNLVLGQVSDGAESSFERLVAAAAEAEVPLKDVSLRPGDLSFVIPLLNVPDWARAREVLKAAGGPALTLTENLAAVSVVGDSLSTTARPLATFWSALRAQGARVLSVQASALRMTAVVDPSAVAALQRSLHASFVVGLAGSGAVRG